MNVDKQITNKYSSTIEFEKDIEIGSDDILRQTQQTNNIQPTRPNSNFDFNTAVGQNIVHANALDIRNVQITKKSFGIFGNLFAMFVTLFEPKDSDKSKTKQQLEGELAQKKTLLHILYSLLRTILQIMYDTFIRVAMSIR